MGGWQLLVLQGCPDANAKPPPAPQPTAPQVVGNTAQLLQLYMATWGFQQGRVWGWHSDLSTRTEVDLGLHEGRRALRHFVIEYMFFLLFK